MNKVEKIGYYISWFLKLSIGGLIVAYILREEYFMAFGSFFFLFLTFLPAITERGFKIRLPIGVDLVFTIVLYLHFFLGGYYNFYSKIAWWDLFLHSGNSVLLGIVGFTFLYALVINKKLRARPLYLALYSIIFVIAIGVLWELFEFSSDQIFATTMQDSGLVDTATDLTADTLGAFVIGAVGFSYFKNPHPGIFEKAIKWTAEFDKKGS